MDTPSTPPIATIGSRGTIAFACLAMLVSYLPFSAVNGVLGTLARSTGASVAGLQWVPDAFAVALGASVLAGGVLGDLYGRRRLTVVGLCLTTTGALVGLISGWRPGMGLVLLWAAQAVAGLGAGVVMSATLALTAAADADPVARARNISRWATALVVGLGAGPFLAAAVTSRAPWNWLFLPVAGLALAVIAFGVACSEESAAPRGRRLDVPGQTTGGFAIASLIFGVINAGSAGWTASLTLAALALAAAAGAGFVAVERRSTFPLLRPALFASRGFIAAALAAMTVLFTITGSVFVLSLFFAGQRVGDLGIAERLGCLFAGNAAASLAASRLQRLLGAPAVLLTGLVVAAGGTLSLPTVTDTTGLAGTVWPLLVVGAGGGLVMATSSVVAVQSVPPALAGMAGGANNAMRQVGAALGPAVLGAVLTMQLRQGADPAAAIHVVAAALAALLAAACAGATVLLTRPGSAT